MVGSRCGDVDDGIRLVRPHSSVNRLPLIMRKDAGMTGLFSTSPLQRERGQLSSLADQPRGQLSLAEALCHSLVRNGDMTELAQCLAPRKQIYVLPVEMDIETKRALDHGETISVWRR